MNLFEIYLDQHGEEWLSIPNPHEKGQFVNKQLIIDGHKFSPLTQYSSDNYVLFKHYAINKNMMYESFTDELKSDTILRDTTIHLKPLGKSVKNVSEFLNPSQIKKFVAVPQPKSAVIVVCLDEKNKVVPYLFEKCPYIGETFHVYTVLDIGYEMYCTLTNISPKYKIDLSERKEQLKNELKNSFGCQSENLKPLIEPIFQILEITAKLPKKVDGVNCKNSFRDFIYELLCCIINEDLVIDTKSMNEVFGPTGGKVISQLINDIKNYHEELVEQNDT